MDAQLSPYRKSNGVERTYRQLSAGDLQKFRICIGESDLMVLAPLDLEKRLKRQLGHFRRQLKQYILDHPGFAETFEPVPRDEQAPELVRWMIAAGIRAGVGPMAAVAGAIAGMLGKNIEAEVRDLIIENGGDIYLRSSRNRVIAVYAGTSVLSNRVGLVIPPTAGMGICTSAGTVGPSVSFGKADAIVILSPDVALADAVATATGNLVKTVHDFQRALAFVQKIPEITGVLIIKDDRMAAWGQIELTPLT